MAASGERPVVVVTGASMGIGRSTSLLLAREGFHVVAVARSSAPLEALRAEAEKMGGAIEVFALDCGNGDDVLAMAKRVLEKGRVPAAVINCAGAGPWKFIEETTPEEAKQMMAAPYHAAFNVTHAFMKSMLERKHGAFIHVQSPAAIVPWAGGTGYAAARFALRGLHEALCQDLIGTGVTSSEVVFGEVTSEYFKNNPGSHEHLPKIASLIRVVTPDECARVLVNVVKHPRRRVIHPFMLAAFNVLVAMCPWLMRLLVGRTGRRH